MKNRINVAELLKDCPTGMELDCALFDAKVIYRELNTRIPTHPIVVQTEHGFEFELTQYGQAHNIVGSKCVIFPKGKTTWEGFVPPCKFKDGDVVDHQNHMGTWIGIYHKYDYLNEDFSSYCCITRDGKFWDDFSNGHGYDKTRLATEEEKEKLFKAINDNGYKWNLETKELEKLIQPKFKVGDWITDGATKCQIHFIDDTQYWYSKNCILGSIESVDERYHLWTINDAKDGDVIFYDDGWTCIFKRIHGIWYSSYCFITGDGEFHPGYEEHAVDSTINGNAHPATEEQCRFLFRKIKEKGYKWNPYTKTLKEPIVPKFKAGYKITNGKISITIGYIDDEYYYEIGRNIATRLFIKNQDEWNLIPKRFNISTLKPFESRVLVRDYSHEVWRVSFWGCLINNELGFKYDTIRGPYKQCIPYEGNEYLLGKTDDCQDFYKIWE